MIYNKVSIKDKKETFELGCKTFSTMFYLSE